ncbi:MAG TPA: alpha/beta fold hydrolase, partial [Allosphingosinicella sp.]
MGKIGVPEAPLSEWTDVPAVGVEMHSRYWPGTGERGAAPILLLPGLALSSRSLFPLARRLSARGYEVHALDLPGFGRTRKPPKATWPAGPNVRAQADQLRDWMDSRGLGRVVLYGISVGSQVAADFAVRYPERVERLVLAGPAPDPAMRTPLRQYGGVLMNMPFEAPSLNDVFQVEYASAGLARMVQQLRRTVDDAIETKLPGIAVPALVVRGQFD